MDLSHLISLVSGIIYLHDHLRYQFINYSPITLMTLFPCYTTGKGHGPPEIGLSCSTYPDGKSPEFIAARMWDDSLTLLLPEQNCSMHAEALAAAAVLLPPWRLYCKLCWSKKKTE